MSTVTAEAPARSPALPGPRAVRSLSGLLPFLRPYRTRDDMGKWHSDPGVQNWMDVGDHPLGAMLFRQALTKQANQPTARKVALARIRDELPASTPSFSPQQRSEQIAGRRAHIASRFRW